MLLLNRKKGDIFGIKDNGNYLIQGDCLTIMKDIEDKSINMILCDLPYGTTQNKWDCPIDLNLLWKEYERIIKDNGVIVLTAQTPFDKVLGSSNLKLLKYEWIWEKTTATGFLNSKKMPMKAHENVLVFYKKPPVYNPIKTSGHKRKISTAEQHKNYGIKSTNYNDYGITSYDSTERYPRTVLKFSTDRQKGSLHPTQKPLALYEYLINTYTNEGDLVLDNCAGSFTTSVACDNTNRKWICIEKLQKYCEIGLKRINENRLTLGMGLLHFNF